MGCRTTLSRAKARSTARARGNGGARHALRVEGLRGFKLRDLSVAWDEEKPEPKWANALYLKGVGEFEIAGINAGQVLLMPVEWSNECARRLGADPHAERALGVPASACTSARWKSPLGQTRYVIAAALRRRNSSEALGAFSVSCPKAWAVNCSIL